MAGKRVDSFTEAKELYGDHKGPRHAGYIVPNIQDNGLAQHGAAGTNMDGIATDFEELRQAERNLADLHDDLIAHLQAANDLSGPLNDGTSPVTGPMRKLFKDRADMEGGVQTALLDYMNELIAVRTAIFATLDTYRGVDEESVQRLQQHMAYLDGEGS